MASYYQSAKLELIYTQDPPVPRPASCRACLVKQRTTGTRSSIRATLFVASVRQSARSRLPLLKRRVDSGAVRIMPPPAGLVRLRRLSEFLRRVRQVIGIAGGAQSWGSLKSDEAH